MSFGVPKLENPSQPWESPAPKKVAISTSDYRPCSIDGIKAIFHRWAEKSWVVPPSPLVGGHSGGTVRGVFAIVEMEDGTVREVEPTQIKFDTTDRRFETLRRHCLGDFECDDQGKAMFWNVEVCGNGRLKWYNCICPVCGKEYGRTDPPVFCNSCGTRFAGYLNPESDKIVRFKEANDE